MNGNLSSVSFSKRPMTSSNSSSSTVMRGYAWSVPDCSGSLHLPLALLLWSVRPLRVEVMVLSSAAPFAFALALALVPSPLAS
jgi:hypothetical protein